MTTELSFERSDVLIERGDGYGEAIQRQLDKRKTEERERVLATTRPPEELPATSARKLVRKSLIETEDRDPSGLERVLGQSDLVSINYLERGMQASRSVCRIEVPGHGGWFGTGFLVAPGLLVTNNHVLGTRQDAAQAEAGFEFEHDLEGVLKNAVRFNLAPHEIFFTDITLDITLVAVTSYSSDGVPLERYGRLPLLPLSGKGLDREWVTIPQHPGGGPKQMAIRKNQIVELEGATEAGIDTHKFIHYVSDTEPGSSGAPVLNDQWQVVAVHHKAVPKPGQNLTELRANGVEPEWIANEGVRVSAIAELLESLRFSNRDVAKALDRIERAIGIPTRLQPASVREANPDPHDEKDPGPHKETKWQTWTGSHTLGYDAGFLPVAIDLGKVLGKKKKEAEKLADGSGVVLDYLHFSTVLHKTRKFPILTAVNIRGDKLIHPGDRSGRFRRDIRIAEDVQPAANFYEKKLGDDPVQFSRGHLVRRLDPCWGETVEEARLADLHTFHYTNAAPQVQGFNAGDWLDIEDYVLNQIQTKERKMTILSGPIFRDHDPIYGASREGGPWKIPVTYWKIAVIETPDDGIAATAFLQGQTKFVEALFEARVFTNLRQNTITELQSDNLQTSIETVEQESGLDFGVLRDHESVNALESAGRVRFLFSPSDIII